MGDMGEFWRDVSPIMKERSKKKRNSNKESSIDILKSKGIKFSTHNDGIHLVVNGKKCLIDFWPSTGKFITRNGKKGRGVFNLLNHC